MVDHIIPPRLRKPKLEPTKAYEAFIVYCKLGDARSISKVAEKLTVSRQNIDKFRQRWWWDQRIADCEDNIQAAFCIALQKKAAGMADKVLALRIEILETQLAAAKAIQAKADLINQLPIIEQTIEQSDGKTFITLKPINVRATDGGRLTLMADQLVRSLVEQTSGKLPNWGGASILGSELLPNEKPSLPQSAEIYVDMGDGTRERLDDLHHRAHAIPRKIFSGEEAEGTLDEFPSPEGTGSLK